jgi:hypothetical protein
MHRPALYTAAAIFAVVGLVHLIRFLNRSEILIAGGAVPVWISLPAAVVLGGLALWMVIAARRP